MDYETKKTLFSSILVTMIKMHLINALPSLANHPPGFPKLIKYLLDLILKYQNTTYAL
jgi:hypothetical protein